MLPQLVNTGFQVLFHSPPGVLFTFPSQYFALSVTEEYLGLRGGPEPAGKYGHQFECTGGESAGFRIPHLRRGCGRGNDGVHPQSDFDAIGRRHARPGQFPAQNAGVVDQCRELTACLYGQTRSLASAARRSDHFLHHEGHVHLFHVYILLYDGGEFGQEFFIQLI